MNLAPLEQINNLQTTPANRQSPDALRKTATEFEAVLLMQLTSALNNKDDDGDEDKLFGSDGGSDMAKKMFTEQLATTMAQSGGIGLSDMIMQKFGTTDAKSGAGKIKNLSDVMTTIKDLKQNNFSPLNNSNKVSPTKNELSNVNADDFEVVSTFEDQIRTEGIDDSDRNLMLDGKIQNSTRPRIVPTGAITEVQRAWTETPLNSPLDLSKKLSFQMPVNGRISSDFGNRFHPIDRKMKFHAGIDIAVPLNTPVGASADGVVKFAGWSDGYGNLVIIQHLDGRESRYGHLNEIQVAEGEKVSGGQQIALSGSTGKSTGPHLHFEIRENGEIVNPFKILSNVLSNVAER